MSIDPVRSERIKNVSHPSIPWVMDPRRLFPICSGNSWSPWKLDRGRHAPDRTLTGKVTASPTGWFDSAGNSGEWRPGPRFRPSVTEGMDLAGPVWTQTPKLSAASQDEGKRRFCPNTPSCWYGFHPGTFNKFILLFERSKVLFSILPRRLWPAVGRNVWALPRSNCCSWVSEPKTKLTGLIK